MLNPIGRSRNRATAQKWNVVIVRAKSTLSGKITAIGEARPNGKKLKARIPVPDGLAKKRKAQRVEALPTADLDPIVVYTQGDRREDRGNLAVSGRLTVIGEDPHVPVQQRIVALQRVVNVEHQDPVLAVNDHASDVRTTQDRNMQDRTTQDYNTRDRVTEELRNRDNAESVA